MFSWRQVRAILRSADALIRKRIGASTFCVISQLCNFKYRKLSLFSGIFWLAFVDIFCWVALNRLKSTRKIHLVAKKKSTYLKYDNNRLEKSRLQHTCSHRYLTCKKITIQGGRKTSRPSEDAKIACILTWRFCTSRHVDEGTRSRLVINRFLLSKAYIDYLAFIIKLRKRIGASIYCVIPQLGDFRYSDLMRLSSIFWLVFVQIFCYIAVNRLKLSRINFQVAKRKSTSLNYQKSRLETSNLEINYGHFDLWKLE